MVGASGAVFGILLALSGTGMGLGAVLIAQIGHNFRKKVLKLSGLGVITWSLILLGQAKGSLTLNRFLSFKAFVINRA